MPLAWHPLRVPPAELRLEHTLTNGQCFGWRRRDAADYTYVGVLGKRVIEVRQTDSDCLFRCLGDAAWHDGAPPSSFFHDAVAAELRSYFQLDRPIVPLYQRWAAVDGRMAHVCSALPGMRVLRQEPAECLFSFICSSNNNIGRIGGMLLALRARYGERIEVDERAGQAAAGGEVFYAFPTVDALAAASEEELRALGLGYRAGYVRATAHALAARGAGWLEGLRAEADPDAVRAELTALRGVGPKVADCVALFSLDTPAAVPVDTHVWDIACRELDPTLRLCASLTPAAYVRVGELFRTKYGECAGWAHCLLFAAELPQFRDALPASLVAELAAWRAEEKREKEERKKRKAGAHPRLGALLQSQRAPLKSRVKQPAAGAVEVEPTTAVRAKRVTH